MCPWAQRHRCSPQDGPRRGLRHVPSRREQCRAPPQADSSLPVLGKGSGHCTGHRSSEPAGHSTDARPVDELFRGCCSPAAPAACGQLLECWGSSCPHSQHRPTPLAPCTAPSLGSPEVQGLRPAGTGPLPPAEPLPIPSGCTDPGHTAPDALRASSQSFPLGSAHHGHGAHHGAHPAEKAKREGP